MQDYVAIQVPATVDAWEVKRAIGPRCDRKRLTPVRERPAEPRAAAPPRPTLLVRHFVEGFPH